MGGTANWLLHYGALLLMAIVCIGVIARVMRAPGEARREPSCGACGHPVGIRPGERCPECGALYNDAGVLTPALLFRLRGGVLWAVLAWSALALIAGEFWQFQSQRRAAAAAATLALANARTTSREYWTLKPEATTGPTYELEFDLVITSFRRALEAGELSMTVRRDAANKFAKLEVNLVTRRYDVRIGTGVPAQSGDTFDRSLVAKTFEAAGLDRSASPEELEEATQRFMSVLSDPVSADQIIKGSGPGAADPFRVVSAGSSTGSAPSRPWSVGPDALSVGVSLFIAIMWAAGCALLTWRARRHGRTAGGAKSPRQMARSTGLPPSS
jgi:hypothetical protein